MAIDPILVQAHRAALRVYRLLPTLARRWVVRLIAPSFTVGAICVIERPDGQSCWCARPTGGGGAFPVACSSGARTLGRRSARGLRGGRDRGRAGRPTGRGGRRPSAAGRHRVPGPARRPSPRSGRSGRRSPEIVEVGLVLARRPPGAPARDGRGARRRWPDIAPPRSRPTDAGPVEPSARRLSAAGGCAPDSKKRDGLVDGERRLGRGARPERLVPERVVVARERPRPDVEVREWVAVVARRAAVVHLADGGGQVEVLGPQLGRRSARRARSVIAESRERLVRRRRRTQAIRIGGRRVDSKGLVGFERRDRRVDVGGGARLDADEARPPPRSW